MEMVEGAGQEKKRSLGLGKGGGTMFLWWRWIGRYLNGERKWKASIGMGVVSWFDNCCCKMGVSRTTVQFLGHLVPKMKDLMRHCFNFV